MNALWFLRGWRKYATAVVLVADLGLGCFSTAMAVAGSTSAPAVSVTTSAKVINWTDNRSSYDPQYVDSTTLDPHDPNQPLFKNLQVTVSQTQDLTDQGLTVSWTGGLPTSAAGAASNYLQIMQCWAGKGQTGPTPQQCQWGKPNDALAAQTGTAASTRDLLTGAEADPKQSLGPAFTHQMFGSTLHTVPFWSIQDPRQQNLSWIGDDNAQPPFSAAQSNEVTMARTGADGTGEYVVDLQSALSAPYLGCGNTAFAAQGDTCWLVIVPRGEYNPNGEKAADQAFNDALGQNPTYVAGSPLSASVWQNRMQVKLNFTPIGANCQLGRSEVNTAGSELVSQAFSSWQAPLCTQGTNFSYSEIGDGEVKTNLVSGASGLPTLGFLSSPLDPSTLAGATVDYAPMTTSALVVSYLIDKSYIDDSSNPDLKSNGTLVTDLKLTPRLVAKLLTQSYKLDTPGDGHATNATVPSGNPNSLRQDPDFLALNPSFKYFHQSSAPDGLIVPFGNSDAAHLVWTWICSDSQARDFLSGVPDAWGAKVNSAYTSLNICNANGTSNLYSFPKADASTYPAPTDGTSKPPSYGTLDLRPYSADFGDGALRTVNARSGSKILWSVLTSPAQFIGGAAQTPGSRFEMAISTSQAADLYGLPVAALLPGGASATDTGVLPTPAAMAAQLGATTASPVAGVSLPNPGQAVSGGYPLTMQTYAAINVCASTTADLTAFASLLDYAASSGQTSGTKLGQLPPGYAPLDSTARGQTATVANDLRAEVKHPKCASHQAAPGSGSTGGTASNPGSSGGSGSPTSSTPTGGSGPTATNASPKGSATPVASGLPGGLTPAADVTPVGQYAMLAALCFAILCLFGGPVLVTAARKMP